METNMEKNMEPNIENEPRIVIALCTCELQGFRAKGSDARV